MSTFSSPSRQYAISSSLVVCRAATHLMRSATQGGSSTRPLPPWVMYFQSMPIVEAICCWRVCLDLNTSGRTISECVSSQERPLYESSDLLLEMWLKFVAGFRHTCKPVGKGYGLFFTIASPDVFERIVKERHFLRR